MAQATGIRSLALAQRGVAAFRDQAGERRQERLTRKGEKAIEEFLRKIQEGEPVRARDGWWNLQVGSARGRVGLSRYEGGVLLVVEAYIMRLPSDKDRIVPLMRELLELNLKLPGPVRLGIAADRVVATSICPIDGLGANGVEACVGIVMVLADQLDDRLLRKYGGSSRRLL